MTQVFSCEFYEIFKNTFLTEHIDCFCLLRNQVLSTFHQDTLLNKIIQKLK